MPSKIVDPVAQSFFIDEPCVVTKVDLYFSNKDDDFPVYLNLRKNVSGLPGPYIIPFSSKVIPASSVNTSSNANVATSVSFVSPIFLEAGEYSLTLGSISNNYKVWISELDGIDTVTEKRITEQPYVGSLFYSQNASTWTPVQADDLKFKLYRAVFDPSVGGTVTFNAENTKYRTALLENDPLEVFPDSTTMRVYHTNHGLSENGYVYIYNISNSYISAGVENTFYDIPSTDIINIPLQVSNVTLTSYTVDLATKANANIISSATRLGGPGVVVTQDIQFDTIYPVISAVKQSTNSITPGYKATSLNYSVDSTFNAMVIGDNDLDSTKLIAGQGTKINNLSNASSFSYKIDLATTDRLTAPLLDTKQLGLVLAKNLVDSPSYDTVVLSQDLVTVATSAAKANLTQLSGQVGLLSFADATDQANAKVLVQGTYLNITGNSGLNDGQYRVIEVLEDGANVRVARLSDDIVTDWSNNTHTITNGTTFISEEAAAGASSYSKYITRQIDFLNASTALNLIIDTCQPPDSTLEFYYKVKTVGDTGELATKEFTQITGVTIPTSLSGEFYEVAKLIDNIDPFNAVVFKVVFKSTNSAKPPKVKNLRLIALQ